MHPFIVLILIFDVLIAVSSVLSLINMMRVNLLVEQKQSESITVQQLRTYKTPAGKGGILPSYFGVYACPTAKGTGEFFSTNPYSSEQAVPSSTVVIPMKDSGVLERCDIWAHLGRRFVPLWLTVAGFSALGILFVNL